MKAVSFRSSLSLLVALAAGCLGAARAHADPVIVNGSFEAPAHANPGVYTGGGDGWIRSFMGPVAIVSGNIQDNNGDFYGVTPFGLQYLGLDVRRNGFISRDSQEIAGFVAGQTYALTLYVADSDGGVAPKLNVLFSDGSDTNYLDQTYDVPVGGPYGDVIAFNLVTTLFTSPVSGSVTLSLTNAGAFTSGANAGSISIDNVSIAAVPEPSTWVIAAGGLGVLLVLQRRTRRTT